jgi:hypothetical protein
MRGVKDVNHIPDLIKNMRRAGRSKVKVGIFDGDVANYAAANEFGCRIKVTDKMRKYLHAKGLHLKKDTTEIVIPERSFIRSAFDDKRETDRAIEVATALFDFNENPLMVLERVGDMLDSSVKRKATSNIRPDNHPFTKEQKGEGKNTLYDQGTLHKSITHEVD